MKKRSRRKQRGRASNGRSGSGTTPQQLMENGQSCLQSGDARQALSLFKQARQVDATLQGVVSFWIYCSYLLRARQLRDRGLAQEATSARGRANAAGESLDPVQLGDVEFLELIRYLDAEEALPIYVAALPQRGPSESVERLLADGLVAQRCWMPLTALPEDYLFRCQAEIVQRALPAMDDGEWTKAAELLRPLPRNSAFAPWRLFCKAMDCFCSQNDEGLTEALKRLPESFALRRVVEELKLTSAAPAERRSSLETQEARKILWASGGEANQLAERLTEAVRERQLSELRRIIPLLAEALYPEAPVQATTELLLVLALAVRRGQLAQPLLLKTVKRLLTTETARLVSNKIRLVTQQPTHSEWEVAGFAEYLSLLPQEFSDEQLPLARARVLEFLARSAHSGDACPDCLPPRVVATLASLVKEPPQDRHLIFVDLMQESLEAEPGNWEGHEFLLSLMRHWGVGKNRIVDALKSMATRFPSQPEPCMELARLYYSRNSYRKAERFLEEARGRATQDESLLDLLAIGYIRSSDQNRIRGRLPRAEKDLWRAEDLQRRRLASVLRVKKLSLQLIASSAAGLEEVKQQLRHLSPLDQLRELGMLILDLRGRQSGSNPRGLNALIPLLNGQTGLADRLTSGEALQLMVPLESELAPLFSSLDLAPVLSRLWDRILDRARGDDLIGLFDTLLEGGEHLYVRKRVERALKALPKRQSDRVLLRAGLGRRLD